MSQEYQSPSWAPVPPCRVFLGWSWLQQSLNLGPARGPQVASNRLHPGLGGLRTHPRLLPRRTGGHARRRGNRDPAGPKPPHADAVSDPNGTVDLHPTPNLHAVALSNAVSDVYPEADGYTLSHGHGRPYSNRNANTFPDPGSDGYATTYSHTAAAETNADRDPCLVGTPRHAEYAMAEKGLPRPVPANPAVRLGPRRPLQP